MCHYMLPGDIIRLNVGGTRLATSRQTLTWVPDSFFTSLISDSCGSLIRREPETATKVKKKRRLGQRRLDDLGRYHVGLPPIHKGL
ncbi:hypothetical protein TNCV_3881661 [Trichonephila clavipes]|nr:hypothetical protein TNCV_3881661 [Trichonephila clavipes]